MELIPILATIILVATVSTFFLSIGAYVLYKVRESKGQQQQEAAPDTIKAELVTAQELKKQKTEQQKPKVIIKPKAPLYKPVREAGVRRGAGRVKTESVKAEQFVSADEQKQQQGEKKRARRMVTVNTVKVEDGKKKEEKGDSKNKKSGTIKWR